MNTDKIDKWGENLEARILRWVKTETVFNFLRHTPGRLALATLTVIALYGTAIFAWFDRGPITLVYPFLVMLAALLQKISVRYVFDDDSHIDELQHKLRNRAYRRAYKRIGLILAAAFTVIVTTEFIQQRNLYESTLPGVTFRFYQFAFQLNIGFSRALVALTFIVGLFVLQKYLSYGIKGEPKN